MGSPMTAMSPALREKAERWTPGPWRVFTTKDGSKLIGIGEAAGGGITDCGFGIWQGGDAEAIANATLIAAAPELYEALSEAFGTLNNLNGWQGPYAVSGKQVDAACEKARAALAKARGEQQP